MMFINSVDITKEIETALPPLGLAYLAAFLRKEFGQDKIEFKIVDRNIKEEISLFKPDIISISSVSQNYNRAMEYASIAKRQSLPVIIGGVHISALPSTLTNDMDVGVLGEGEETLVEIIKNYLEGGCFNKDKFSGIDGIVFRKNGQTFVTAKRNQIKPLDRIPMPARDLLTITKSTYMFSSRGCPYKCTFCSSCRFWGSLRFFSAEYVANEIKSLVERYGVRKISFWDDLFVADRERLKKIFEFLKREGLLGQMEFTCHVRSNLVDDELAVILKQMGFSGIGMGLESGSSTTLEYLKGPNISVQKHINAINILRKHGIDFCGSFIIGSPKESREDVLTTLEFIKKNGIDDFDLYVLTPLPGTPVWDYAKERGLVDEQMDWSKLSINFEYNHENAVILSEKLTREELYKLFKLFRRYKLVKMMKKGLRNPKLILKGVAKILSGRALIIR
jgi:magnesium-protoporphyrin IX monomethyl ester (oxidative) cyclase